MFHECNGLGHEQRSAGVFSYFSAAVIFLVLFSLGKKDASIKIKKVFPYFSKMNKRLTLISSLCLWLTLASPLGVLGTAVNLDSLWGVWNDKTMNEQKAILETTMAEWKGDT